MKPDFHSKPSTNHPTPSHCYGAVPCRWGCRRFHIIFICHHNPQHFSSSVGGKWTTCSRSWTLLPAAACVVRAVWLWTKKLEMESISRPQHSPCQLGYSGATKWRPNFLLPCFAVLFRSTSSPRFSPLYLWWGSTENCVRCEVWRRTSTLLLHSNKRASRVGEHCCVGIWVLKIKKLWFIRSLMCYSIFATAIVVGRFAAADGGVDKWWITIRR